MDPKSDNQAFSSSTAKAIVLVSGGLDSAVCIAIAKRLGFQVFALTVSYGQRHQFELIASKAITKAAGIKDHRTIGIDLNVIGGSSLTDDLDVPKGRPAEDLTHGIPNTYVPARNLVFLSLALGYAEVVGSEDIFIGVNAVDYSGYPDCRPEFISEFQNLTKVATKAGIEGNPATIHVPLISLSKSQIIHRGLDLGVDFSLTSSCYDPSNIGEPCHQCDSCQIREKAFRDIGMEDPLITKYSTK